MELLIGILNLSAQRTPIIKALMTLVWSYGQVFQTVFANILTSTQIIATVINGYHAVSMEIIWIVIHVNNIVLRNWFHMVATQHLISHITHLLHGLPKIHHTKFTKWLRSLQQPLVAYHLTTHPALPTRLSSGQSQEPFILLPVHLSLAINYTAPFHLLAMIFNHGKTLTATQESE